MAIQGTVNLIRFLFTFFPFSYGLLFFFYFFFYTKNSGTWLEIHIPEDERIVAERQLPGGFAVGYQVIDMPLTYKFSPDRVICAGDYEIWWVQRTPSRKYIQYRKKFRVMHPPCDFNRILDKYTRFFDFRYDVKNSLDGSSISLEDLLDISTTKSSADIGV